MGQLILCIFGGEYNLGNGFIVLKGRCLVRSTNFEKRYVQSVKMDFNSSMNFGKGIFFYFEKAGDFRKI